MACGSFQEHHCQLQLYANNSSCVSKNTEHDSLVAGAKLTTCLGQSLGIWSTGRVGQRWPITRRRISLLALISLWSEFSPPELTPLSFQIASSSPFGSWSRSQFPSLCHVAFYPSLKGEEKPETWGMLLCWMFSGCFEREPGSDWFMSQMAKLWRPKWHWLAAVAAETHAFYWRPHRPPWN